MYRLEQFRVPDYVDLKLTVRSYETEVQMQLLDAIERIVRAEYDASRSPQAPVIKTILHAPATENSAIEADVFGKSFL